MVGTSLFVACLGSGSRVDRVVDGEMPTALLRCSILIELEYIRRKLQNGLCESDVLLEAIKNAFKYERCSIQLCGMCDCSLGQ